MFFKNISPKQVFGLVALLIMCSCASPKNVVYYQNSDTFAAQDATSYEVKIQPDDVLTIIVSAEDPEIALPFNLPVSSVQNITGRNVTGQQALQTYLVNREGEIEFPILGTLKIGGLSRSDVVKLLKNKIGLYVKNPIINLRITNFKVAVQGEVTAPGSYSIASERLTLIEALSMARDLTIHAKRDNILVIREDNGVKTFNRVDLTSADFINSPFYYLAQNDVIYVQPNKVRVNASAVGPNTSVILSTISLLITISVILFK